MIVYRITASGLSKGLKASGNAARWNSKNKYVLYTSSNRALACLENIVHRSGEGFNRLFKVLVIEIPEEIKITEINIKNLPANWFFYRNQYLSQELGNIWITKGHSCVLKVPSVIIKEESNYLINPAHPDFKMIKVLRTEDFEFDQRLTTKR
jgi:RES domain-containing protein